VILSWEKGKHRPDDLEYRFTVLDTVLDGIPPSGIGSADLPTSPAARASAWHS
jgi:hypothetical protein